MHQWAPIPLSAAHPSGRGIRGDRVRRTTGGERPFRMVSGPQAAGADESAVSRPKLGRHSQRRMSWLGESPTAPCRPLSKPTYRQATRICSRPVQPPLLDAGREGNSPIPALCDAIRGPESTTERATEEPEPPRPPRLSTHKRLPSVAWDQPSDMEGWRCWPLLACGLLAIAQRELGCLPAPIPLGLSEAVLANGVTMSPPVRMPGRSHAERQGTPAAALDPRGSRWSAHAMSPSS
ncbi:hypothetical protein B0T18DRAFT_47963 [Schizothecium vesticola]|uniref:Uncharacterized protein n=1 Tax=Schizothecium vesticola TaxID=314040 RepID=A0AA40KDH6_9PEZI|nr:hypothetical protein B0T18DRAFT_47963 [Schizothecium vesticola]